MNDTGRWRLGRRPALDGLRGVAVLMVLGCHVLDTARPAFHALGAAGVTVFFTLSGFLITALLMQEERPSMRRFYVRRARRLLPALVVVVIVVGTTQAAMGLASPASVVPVLFYAANWALASGHDLGLMGHAWSLSIEEQFYVVWPLLLLAVRRWRNGPIVAAAAGTIASFALCFTLWPEGWSRVYFGSDTHAGSLLAGCALAILAPRLRAWRPGWVQPLGLLMFGLLVFVHSEYVAYVIVPVVVPIVTTAMIWAACSGAVVGLSSRWLGYVGRRSYALYLWHFPLVLLAQRYNGSVAASVVAVAFAFVLAEMSWRWVEQPFLQGRSARGVQVSDLGRGERVVEDRGLVEGAVPPGVVVPAADL